MLIYATNYSLIEIYVFKTIDSQYPNLMIEIAPAAPILTLRYLYQKDL